MGAESNRLFIYRLDRKKALTQQQRINKSHLSFQKQDSSKHFRVSFGLLSYAYLNIL